MVSIVPKPLSFSRKLTTLLFLVTAASAKAASLWINSRPRMSFSSSQPFKSGSAKSGIIVFELFLGVGVGWDWGSSSFLQGEIWVLEANWESSNPEETRVHSREAPESSASHRFPSRQSKVASGNHFYCINYLIRLRWQHSLPGAVRRNPPAIFRPPRHTHPILFQNAICLPKFLSISVSYKETVGFSHQFKSQELKPYSLCILFYFFHFIGAQTSDSFIYPPIPGQIATFPEM